MRQEWVYAAGVRQASLDLRLVRLSTRQQKGRVTPAFAVIMPVEAKGHWPPITLRFRLFAVLSYGPVWWA